MANFNKVILAGNLTRDIELRYTQQGKAIARLGLAVNRNYTLENGEKREEVTFIDVDAFGKQAETLAKYMRKGRPLLIEGRLKLDTWEDKNTHQKVSKLRVVLETFQFLGDSRGAGEGGGAPRAEQAGMAAAPAAAGAAATADNSPDLDGPPPEDDDVPF